jgi:hypothetical protein
MPWPDVRVKGHGPNAGMVHVTESHTWMTRQKIAHRFPPPYGWEVGRVHRKRSAEGEWEVKYGENLYQTHKLEKENYGIDKDWVFVKYLGKDWSEDSGGTGQAVTLQALDGKTSLWSEGRGEDFRFQSPARRFMHS